MSKQQSIVHALIAVIAPALNVLVFYVLYWRVLRTTTPNRTVAALMLLLLVAGGYSGLVVLRSKDAAFPIRIVGLAGAVVCIVWAVPLLIFAVLEGL